MGIVMAIFRDVVKTQDCPTCEAEAGAACEEKKKGELLDRLGGIEKFKARVASTGRPAR